MDIINEVNMEARVRSSMVQLVTLLKFMETHGDIARLRGGPVNRRKCDLLWEELAATLNSVDNIRQKPPEKWKKVWTDWKSKTKSKAVCLRQARAEGRPTRQLTPLEKRILTVPSPWEVKQEGTRKVEVEVEVLKEEVVEEQEDHNASQLETINNQSDGEQSPAEDAASDMDQSETTVDIKPIIHDQITQDQTIQNQTIHDQTIYDQTTQDQTLYHQTIQDQTIDDQIIYDQPIHNQTIQYERPKITITRQKQPQPQKSTSRVRKPSSNSNAGLERVLDKFASIEMRRLQVEERRDRQLHERELRRIEVESERNHLLRSLVNIARSWVDHQTDPLNNTS